MLVVVGRVLGIVLLAVWAVRRCVPATREGFDAEVSSQVLGVVASLFGLLLAFVVVIEFQAFSAAGDNVADRGRRPRGDRPRQHAFGEPGGAEVRSAIGDYVRAVVDDEWPLMRDGQGEPGRLARRSTACSRRCRRYRPVSTSQVAFYDDSVRHLNAVLEARRDRLGASDGNDLPVLIAALILVGSIVILGYVTLVGSTSAAFHAIGAGSIAVIVGLLARGPPHAPVPVLRRPRGRLAPVPGGSAGAALRAAEMTHDQALTALGSVLDAAAGPVSVVVVDTHGEVVASVAMSGAARDTYLNAQRKAYTAARSDAFTTRQLAEKAGGSPTELASFDPQFSFFLGGVAAFRDGVRVGAVGVSGLPGEVDEAARDRGDPRRRARRPRRRRSGADDERAQPLPLGREVEAERQEHERVDEDEADRRAEARRRRACRATASAIPAAAAVSDAAPLVRARGRSAAPTRPCPANITV